MAKSKPKKQAHHLIRLGPNSTVVVLPTNIVRSLGWKKHQRVLIKRIARGVKIIDARTKQ